MITIKISELFKSNNNIFVVIKMDNIYDDIILKKLEELGWVWSGDNNTKPTNFHPRYYCKWGHKPQVWYLHLSNDYLTWDHLIPYYGEIFKIKL